MSGRAVAAVDLGAESGRVVEVAFDGERLATGRATRFEHERVHVGGKLRWDLDGLWSSIRDGLVSLGDRRIEAIGVDTWGVDYGLFDAHGRLVEPPTSYRDPQRAEAFHAALRQHDIHDLYLRSGIQVLEINTIFGLLSDLAITPGSIAAANRLLMLPDVFHHRLCGSVVTEFTAATTSGLVDMRTGAWAADFADELGIPSRILPEIVPPGTVVGTLRDDLASGGLRGASIIVPASHDTASAVLAEVDASPATLYISSGTWSLVGVTLDEPIISEASAAANFTNEGGYGGTVRFLKNVMGLWVLQECRREWRAGGTGGDYAELVAAAAAEPAGRIVFDIDDPEFLAPGGMPDRIRGYCARHGLPVPETRAQLVRAIIDSLAVGYVRVARAVGELTGVPVERIVVVGGGTRNELLLQSTADATGLPVEAGPAEATALGNAAVQLAALGEFSGGAEIAAAIRASEPRRGYAPSADGRWHDALAVVDRLVAARYVGGIRSEATASAVAD